MKEIGTYQVFENPEKKYEVSNSEIRKMPATSIHPEFTARRVQEMSILKYNFLHFQKRNITVCPTMWSFAFLI